MKSKFALSFCLAFLLQLGNIPCVQAWNDFGHMSVAYLAYKKLAPRTKARVNSLLKLNPYYDTWKKQLAPGTAGDKLDTQIFMLAATWPDLIKKDPNYISDGGYDGNRPQGVEASRNIGYSDHLMHKYWHFYDMPFSQDGSRILAPIPAPNAQSQIAACRKVLASDASEELKSYDLTWLLHMVGDLHQPMHCATRVSKFAADGDNGGNDVLVNFDDKLRYRLHTFWDACLGTGLPPDVIKSADRLAPAKAALAADLKVNDWIKESFELAKQDVYVSPIRWGNGPFDLTPDYRHNAMSLARQRVVLAGERLANVLNKELK